jgi:serine protease Do
MLPRPVDDGSATDKETTPMAARSRFAALAITAGLGLSLAACGGGGSSDATATPDSATKASAGAGAVSDLESVQDATVQIVAQGSIRDPEVGYSTQAGAGSGFFISPDGLAVTNNHVVTGAGTLEVRVGGDDGESYNAEVLGVSECNDLAVLKVDVDGPVPFLDWHDGDIAPGLDVYAAGFPLGDPEYTLTRGVVAKAEAGGDLTGTSSIDYTIEHDATIQPGNSGGPLVDDSGRVVGINYAGGAPGEGLTSQYYAIAAPLAEDVVVDLQQGDVESLGVNGWAVYDDSAGIAGIWVAGVAPGSPASEADVLPGDIITTLNGVPMGQDGTFADYCDVIRTAGSKPISAEVLRYDTEEVLRGEINGDQPIELAYSFAREIEQQSSLGGGQAYTSYRTVTDDTGTLTVDVPTAWSDTVTAPAQTDIGTIPYISASTSVADFDASYTVPGMAFLAAPMDMSAADGLAQFAPSPGECTDGGIVDYDDGRFSGQYQIWEGCGGVGGVYVVLVSSAADSPGYTFVVAVQAVSEADLAVIDQIFATFDVT